MLSRSPVKGKKNSIGRIPANNWLDDKRNTKTPMTSKRREDRRPDRNRGFIVLRSAPEEIRATENWVNWQITGGYRHSKKAGLSTPPELAKALRELEQVSADAEEDGLDIPSEVAFANARRLLRAMYRISPRRFGVYPEPGGYIAIDARGANDGIAVVMCDSDGGVLCLVTIGDEPRRARYSTARTLPDGFIRDALRELGADPA